MAAAGVADLVSAADIRFSFSKPRKFPGEADSRPEIIVVSWVNALVRFGRLRPDKLGLCQQACVHTGVRIHPVAETAAGHSEQCQPILVSSRPNCQSLAFVRYAVIFPADSSIQSELGVQFPIVFEE